MQIECFFSAPGRDIPLTDHDRARPFLIAPETPHPSLVLGDYLDAVIAFLLDDHCANLLEGLRGLGEPHSPLGEKDTLIIRTEKHGALYHIASASCRRYQEKESGRLALTTAVAPASRDRLTREFYLLRTLSPRAPESLPRVFTIADRQSSAPHEVIFSIMSGQWLEGYHEWHLSGDGQGSERVLLWDYALGHHFLDQPGEIELIRNAALILTRLYDLQSGSQVYPWHHGAGDFIASDENSGGVQVRLITVRGHGPLLEYPPEAGIFPPLFSFFLHIALRLRLDRLDGTGRVAWFGDHVLAGAIAGFFDGLVGRPVEQREILEILSGFSAEELQTVYGPLLDIYQQENPEDAAVIAENLERHCHSLSRALGDFSLPEDG